jgi:hypothetical protein
MAPAAKTKSKAKKTAEPTPEVDDELELDEVGDDEVEDAPTKKGGDEVTFGASDLAKYLSEKSGKTVSPRELRTLIRKMARDGKGRVNREITPGNRTRYNWSGVDDPEVQAIIKAFNSGELEADKKAKLEELKARKAEKKAAGEPVGKKAKAKAGKKGKKAEPVAEVEDDDEDLDLDDDE